MGLAFLSCSAPTGAPTTTNRHITLTQTHTGRKGDLKTEEAAQGIMQRRSKKKKKKLFL